MASTNGSTGPKQKACLKCRGMKMKCRVDDGPSCRRCIRAGTECIFKPRANAAASRNSPPAPPRPQTLSLNPEVRPSESSEAFQAVLDRLDKIEAFVGLHAGSPVNVTRQEYSSDQEDPALTSLWISLTQLKKGSRQHTRTEVWSARIVKELWLGFHKNMPGLHFLPTKQTFSAPTPLLLASMLYVSSLRHAEPRLADLSSDYFKIMCEAISHLSIPQLESEAAEVSDSDVEENAFQDVLGIILAGLTCEASAKTTGIWISIGYRLVLESCPRELDVRSREWQMLFSGLQILDLEHASLHMSCPIIPLHAPLSRLHVSSEDDINSLSQMMHTGLTHFTGRGLPTIWSCFSKASKKPLFTSPFTPIDAAVIRDWAAQLDRWLGRFNTSSEMSGKSENDRKLVFRQYILHRLLVLSIYHPARGFNLFSTSTTSGERRELLMSARAALKMQLDDRSIWVNWDFVMITWAALLVLQGIEGGVGEENDLPMVQDLLNTLRMTQEPATGIRNQLADQLEANFQNIHTPPAPVSPSAFPINADNMSWTIFDEMSLQFPYVPQWSNQDPLQ